MKRKKWTEAEEVTLLSAYADLGAISRLKTREKKLQPVADRVNSLHHLRDPSSFPYRWSWRDVSIKIHNMRNQYLGVKQKVLLPSPTPGSPPTFDWDLALHHWPNFLRYKHVFGDLHLDPPSSPRKDDAEHEYGDGVRDDDKRRSKARRPLAIARRIVEVGEAAVTREERRREGEVEESARWRWMEVEEEEERRWRRRREERREEEEREWMERMMGMQMEHEKAVMQMQAEACQMQLQVSCLLGRVICQFLGPMGGGEAGLGVLHNLQGQEQQRDQGSMGPENGKSDTSSPGQYM